jgi:hypothetical protein
MEGRAVNTWKCNGPPALSTYLLDNGHLLRTCNVDQKDFHVSGGGDRVQEFTWEGDLIWDFKLENRNLHLHHDIARLPNGNILMLVSERISANLAVLAGTRADTREILADAIVEVKPTGRTTGEIVWEWHVWDHLVQDHDSGKVNYAKVSRSPQRVDVNYLGRYDNKMITPNKVLDKLKVLGYVGGSNVNPPVDWTHLNAVDYNADLDQIMVCSLSFEEFWIIDHGTTTKEAAGSIGGKSGKGGDLLYRWGNPASYGCGSRSEQHLFRQHNAHWIQNGLPGAGNVLVFNNGDIHSLKAAFSSVEEFALPRKGNGTNQNDVLEPFVPCETIWSYAASPKAEFFSKLFSGAQRLPNGNTLICSGWDGIIFEVTPQKEIVWKYGVQVASDTKKHNNPSSDVGPVRSPSVLFRAYRYGLDHPAIKGRDLTPGKKLEES